MRQTLTPQDLFLMALTITLYLSFIKASKILGLGNKDINICVCVCVCVHTYFNQNAIASV